jgi:phospholipase D1/2
LSDSDAFRTLVTTWKQYKEFVAHHERLQKPAKDTQVDEAAGAAKKEETQNQNINLNSTSTSNLSNSKNDKDKPPVGRVPSEGGNSETGINTRETEVHDAAEDQLGKGYEENIQQGGQHEDANPNGRPTGSNQTSETKEVSNSSKAQSSSA